MDHLQLKLNQEDEAKTEIAAEILLFSGNHGAISNGHNNNEH